LEYREVQFNAFFKVIWNKVLDFLHNNFGACIISHRYPDGHSLGHSLATTQPRLQHMRLILVVFPEGVDIPNKTRTPDGLDSNNYPAVQRDY
jgi:hypothetical protein